MGKKGSSLKRLLSKQYLKNNKIKTNIISTKQIKPNWQDIKQNTSKLIITRLEPTASINLATYETIWQLELNVPRNVLGLLLGTRWSALGRHTVPEVFVKVNWEPFPSRF